MGEFRIRRIGVVIVVEATLFCLTCVAVMLASCNRQGEDFRVAPVAARATTGPATAPLRAGSGGLVTTTSVSDVDSQGSTAPPPRDLDTDPQNLAQGRLLYQSMNCAGCHGAHGGGGIGPALSDAVWIHGWQPGAIFYTIVHGRPNGMPSFGGKIADQQVWQLVAYVRSLGGLGSPDAAPGRSDQMAGGAAPNSIKRASPRSSESDRQELERSDQAEFARRGWMDAASGDPQIPANVVRSVTTQRAAPATRPAATSH